KNRHKSDKNGAGVLNDVVTAVQPADNPTPAPQAGEPGGSVPGAVPAPTPAQRTPAQLKDGLDLWDSEAGGTAAALAVVRIDLNESLLVPFTTSMLRVKLHFLDTPAYRGFIHCPGDGCLLCRIGRKSEVRDLLPVYDAVARAVGVLPISESLRPNAL